MGTRAHPGWRANPTDATVSALKSWLGTGVGASSAALAVTLHPALLLPVLVLDRLPQLLITTLPIVLAIVAIRSPHPTRQDAANKILDKLLIASDPRQPSTHTPRRRKTPRAPKR